MSIEQILNQRAAEGLLGYIQAALDASPEMTPLELSLRMITLATDEDAPTNYRGIAILTLQSIMRVSLEHTDRELFIRKILDVAPSVISKTTSKLFVEGGVR